MAFLFADEDFPHPVVALLRSLGHDVMTVQEAGLAGIKTGDPAILILATQHARAVLTMNRRDFFSLHKSHPSHAGIIACARDDDVAALAGRLHAAVASLKSLAGQLIRITRPHPSQKP